MVRKKHKIWQCFFSMIMCLTLVLPLWWIQAEDADAAFSDTIAAVWNQAVADFEWVDTGLTPWNGASSGTAVSTADAKVITAEGNEVDAYEIYTPEQFRWAMSNKKHMKLMADLDMGGSAGRNWTNVAGIGNNTTHWVIEGNDHTIYNLNMANASYGLFSDTASNRFFFMKNLNFKSCQNVHSGYGYKSIIGRLNMGYFYNIGLEDSLVRGNSFNGGLISNEPTTSGNTARAAYPLYVDNCYTRNVNAYSTVQCIASLVCCTGNIEVTNSYSIDGSVIAAGTAGHSGAFVSCIYAGGKVENCFSNVDAYAPQATGAFIGVIHAVGSSRTFDISNNYGSGKIQGNSALGGFIGGNQDAQSGYINVENCYSTAGVGLDATASNLGGFHGIGTVGASSPNQRYYSYKNCYMAGEVGTESTSTTSGSVYAVSATTVSNGETYDGMYYDKQTTGMKERASAANRSGIQGMLTKDLMETRIDGKGESDSEWVLSDGAYPQLKVFTDPDTFVREEGKAISKAYSQASVSTAILYPSYMEDSKYNTAVTNAPSDYDTVRSIRYAFPLTNNSLIGSGAASFDLSWRTDGAKSPITRLTDTDVITLSDPPDYEVIGTAPGVSTLSVEAALTDGSGVIGKRNQRLIPRNAFILSDMSRTIYHVRDDTARNVWESDASGGRDNLFYNMKIGIMFSYVEEGNPITNQYVTVEDLDDSGVAVWDVDNDADGDYYYLKNPTEISSKFTGNIKVHVLDEDGNAVTIDGQLTKLLQGERPARLDEAGKKYVLQYHWYTRGFGYEGVIERNRTLTIKLSSEITYHYRGNNGDVNYYEYTDHGPYTDGEAARNPGIDPRVGDESVYLFQGWAEIEKLEDFDEDNPVWYDPAASDNAMDASIDPDHPKDRTIWAIYENLGDIELNVAPSVQYGISEEAGGNKISTGVQRYKISSDDMQLEVKDTRTVKEAWKLTAQLEDVLTCYEQDGSVRNTLPKSLVYHDGTQDKELKTDTATLICQDINTADSYDIYDSWYGSENNKGLYVRVAPGDVKIGTYKATINWLLTDAL